MLKKHFPLLLGFLVVLFMFPRSAFAQNCVCSGNPGCGNFIDQTDCLDNSCNWDCTTVAPSVIVISGVVIPTSPPPPPVFCNGGSSEIKTALGCAPVDGTQLLNALLKWGVIVGGTLATLLAGYSGFQISTASGDPKKMKAGQELLVSAIAGLILIALAIVIINFLGYSVLQIPTFKV